MLEVVIARCMPRDFMVMRTQAAQRVGFFWVRGRVGCRGLFESAVARCLPAQSMTIRSILEQTAWY